MRQTTDSLRWHNYWSDQRAAMLVLELFLPVLPSRLLDVWKAAASRILTAVYTIL